QFEEIVRLVEEKQPEREELVEQAVVQLQDALKEAKIKASVSGRPKHYWSIYQKMVIRGREFDDIFDLTGIRVVTDSLRDCYAALGVVHGLWKPMERRFKDYIAMPKRNMYQGLHTAVVGPKGKPLEIQIRTESMN